MARARQMSAVGKGQTAHEERRREGERGAKGVKGVRARNGTSAHEVGWEGAGGAEPLAAP